MLSSDLAGWQASSSRCCLHAPGWRRNRYLSCIATNPDPDPAIDIGLSGSVKESPASRSRSYVSEGRAYPSDREQPQEIEHAGVAAKNRRARSIGTHPRLIAIRISFS